MGRIIEAKAVISAEDRTGAVFDKISKKFREVGKGAKVSAEVGRLAKQLDAANNSLRSIDKFRGSQATFAQAREHFRGTQQQVARLAKELDGARKAAAAFDGIKTFSKGSAIASEMTAARKRVATVEKALTAAQRSVKSASEVYDAQAVALKASKHHAEASGVSVAKLASEQTRLKNVVEDTNAAMLRQGSIQQATHSMTAGMGAVGRQTSDQIAINRRLADGMSAPARAERAARLRQAQEAQQAEIRRRATASGDLVAGMGVEGRRTARHIEDGRRLTEGMSAPGRIERAERERVRRDAEEARATAHAERRSARREAAGTVAAGAGIMAAHKGKQIGLAAVDAAADFDQAVRKQRVFTELDLPDQDGLLKQAKQIGQETQFSNTDVVKAQTAAMQGLPAEFGSQLKAEVAQGIVANVRNYATLMETDLKEGAETIRSYLQATGKDISTKEKALAEANKATNQMVKMAKLGGMSGEDVAQYMKYAAASATASGLTTDTTMSLGALARRGGLRGDEAGVFMRSAANKLVSPTNKGLAAYNAAGIEHSKFVRMPDKLSTSALEGQFRLDMGKSFTPEIRKRVDAINADKALIADRGKYVEAVTEAVSPMLGKTKKGKVRASDAKVAAKAAGNYHKVGAQSVDAEGLLDALMSSNATLAQLNAILTDKHGGKGAITQRQWEEFKASRAQIKAAGDDPDYAKKKADEILAGLYGSITNMKGSFENATVRIGEAITGPVKVIADATGKAVDGFSGLDDKTIQVAAGLTTLGAATAGLAGTMKITGALLGLPALAAGAGVVTMLGTLTLAGAAAAGVLYALGDEKKGLVHGGKPDITMNPGDELPGLDGSTALPSWAPPAKVGPNTPLVTAGVPSLIDAGRKDRSAAVTAATNDLARHQRELQTLRSESGGLSDLGLPGVGSGQDARIAEVQAQIRQAEERLKGLRQSTPSVQPPVGGGGLPPLSSQMVPLPPARPAEFGGRTIPVEVVSLPSGSDRSGQEHAIGNTLDKAADSATTAANGGKPIEATVRPDQITAKVTEMPAVTGEATVTVDNHHQITVTLNTDMLDAKVNAAANKAVAKIPLNSGGGRPGAVSMPGAASAPGAN